MHSFKSYVIIEKVEQHLIENNLKVNDVSDEQLDEIIGMAAKAVGGVAKLAAKGVRRTLQNKQGNFRLSRAGRNDARQAKADAYKKKTAELKRQRKTQADLRKARQDYKDAKKAHNQSNP